MKTMLDLLKEVAKDIANQSKDTIPYDRALALLKKHFTVMEQRPTDTFAASLRTKF